MSEENGNLYKCEICGSIYEDMKSAENCESKCKKKRFLSDKVVKRSIIKSRFKLGQVWLLVFILIVVGCFVFWQHLEKNMDEVSYFEQQGNQESEGTRESGLEVKTSEEEKNVSFKKSEEIVGKFINKRMEEDAILYTFLPEDVKTADTTYGIALISFSEIVLTTPRLASYEIVESKEVDSSRVQVSAKSYLENEEGNKVGYYYENFTVDTKGKTPIVFFGQSDYKPLNEEDECRNLSNTTITEERDHCYWRTAFERRDINLCDKIEGVINKYICYREIAILKNDFSICQKNLEILPTCAFRFGINNLNEEFCEKAGSDRNICLYRVAVLKNDSSICAKCTDDYRNSKEVCEDYFKKTQGKTFGRELIRIINPKPNQEISSPIKIEGWGTANQGKIYIKIEDENKNELALDYIGVETGPFHYPFNITIPYSQTGSEKGLIKVFGIYEKDAINKTVVIPVNFKETPVLLPQSPKPSEWKVYKNGKDAYEIEYPSDWSHSVDGPIHDFCNLSPIEGIERDCGPGFIGISLRNDASDATAPDYCTMNPSSILCTKEGVNLQETIVNGREGKIFRVKTGNINYKCAFWKKNTDDETAYELRVSLSGHPELEEIFDKMLYSFNFIGGDDNDDSGGDNNNDKHPLLSEGQEAILESLGVDVSSLPLELTPEMESCFIEKLGQERVDEIIGGVTPNIFDFFKAKSCIKE